MSPQRYQVRVFPTSQELHRAAAERIVELARRAIESMGRFSLALSGGSTPKDTYAELAKHYATAVAWEHVHFWWSDERCVPHDHEHSNARLATEALLRHIPAAKANIHRVPTHLAPQEAAAAYERELRAFDPVAPLDLTLLGLGTDGHTASLFPGSPALDERTRWVVAARAPQGAPVGDRVTFTLPLLATSRRGLFLVSGAEKRSVVEQVLGTGSPGGAPVHPAARVAPQSPPECFLDSSAAGHAVQ